MEYTQIVSEGSLSKLKEIAELIVTEKPVKIISQPSPGMIMIKHIDPLQKTPFYIGEAFVTQCEVEIDGKLGYGCTLGNESERALYGAILDAVLGNGSPISSRILPLIKQEEAELLKRYENESRRTASTKVNFDVKKG